MISYVRGNLLDSKATILVNTVNCVGVMGKGIALQFKQRFPEMFEVYRQTCKAGGYSPGVCRMCTTSGKTIINFPTKNDWRNPSQMEWIQSGLIQIKNYLMKNPSVSIAFPPVGCGNGGLNWEEVRALMEDTFKDLPNDIQIYGRGGTNEEN